MIAFTCTTCHKKFSTKQELAGKKIKCPGCGTVVTVPTAQDSPVPAAAAGPGPLRDLPTLAPSGAGQPVLPPDQVTQPPSSASEATKTSGAGDGDHASMLTEFLAPPQADDELGRLGGFRILKILGHGGMGVVFQGEDPKLGRQVAIKAMLPHLAGSQSSQQRFLREAKSAATLEHDHIVPIFHVGEDRGAPFIVMPLLKGESLEERLQRAAQLSIAEVLRIGRETAEGLAAAHERGLIHRDIKPANVWLEGARGRVKILDFGLARAAADESGLTQQGAVIGTPAYMAPEQGRGDTVDARCDLWSLGVMLYRLSTGQLPFKGADTVSTLIAVAMNEPPPARQVNAAVPAGLSDLIMKLLAKEPAKRIASAQEVAAALREIKKAGDKTATLDARPTRKVPAGVKTAGGRRWVWPAVAAGVVLLLAGVTVAVLLQYTGPVSTGEAKGGSSQKDKTLPPKDTVAQVSKPKDSPGDFRPLFNGHDLTGWEKVGGANWSAANGILEADGLGRGWLGTKAEFTDFELEFEYRLPNKGNSGIFVRPWKGGVVEHFLEVQLLDDAGYKKIPPNKLNGSVFGKVAPKPFPFAPAGKWHKVRVKMVGPRIQVSMNGMQVVDADVPTKEKAGPLGLQVYDTSVEFRNIQVRDLSASAGKK